MDYEQCETVRTSGYCIGNRTKRLSVGVIIPVVASTLVAVLCSYDEPCQSCSLLLAAIMGEIVLRLRAARREVQEACMSRSIGVSCARFTPSQRCPRLDDLINVPFQMPFVSDSSRPLFIIARSSRVDLFPFHSYVSGRTLCRVLCNRIFARYAAALRTTTSMYLSIYALHPLNFR